MYSSAMLTDWKRDSRVFHDLSVTPVAAITMRRVIRIFRGVKRRETVAIAAPSSTKAMMITPAREIVRITPKHASTMARAERPFSILGIREAIAATKTGAVVHKKTERLFESSRVP